MRFKRLHVIIPVLILLTIVVLFIFRGAHRQTTPEHVSVPESVNEPESYNKKIKNTFGLVSQKTPSLQGKFDVRWQKWIERETEALLKEYLAEPEFKSATETQIASIRKQLYPQIVAHAEKVMQHNPDGPPESPSTYRPGPTTKGSLLHKGPQTPEAIMETYDAWYDQFYPSDSTAEAKYPRAEWIQELLDMGITFTTEAHYPRMMDIRYHLVRVEDNPEEWASGSRGVSPQDNFEDYKQAYIQRKDWESQQVDNAEAADPDVSGGFFFDDAPDVFLPGKRDRLYVHRSIDDGIPGVDMWGEVLSTKQRFDLIYRGEHPEGWEVIYLDEDYNVLSEEPPHVTREMVREWQLPPEDWTPPEGVTLPEGFEEDLRTRGWKGAWTQEPTPTEGPLQQDRAALAREAVEAEKAAAKVEWKDFEQALQEFERSANMSDAELEAEFQKVFMSSLPGLLTDEGIEKTIREQFSPARFEKAEKLLQQYGPEEGFRRLAKDDAELAKQLENIFGKRSTPSQKNGRFVPKGGPPATNAQPPPEDDSE